MASSPVADRAGAALGRHPRDLVRVLGSAVIVTAAFLVARTHRVDPLEAALYRDAQNLPAWLAPMSRAISVGGSPLGIAIVAGLALLAHQIRGALKLVAAGTAGWVAGNLLSVFAPTRIVTVANVPVGRGGHHSVVLHTTFPADRMAVAGALATVVTPYLPRVLRFVPAVLLALLAVSQAYTGHHLALDIATGAFIGFGIGSAFHLVWGAPGRAASTTTVERALKTAGFDPAELRPVVGGLFGPRVFEGCTCSGTPLLVEVVRRGQRRAGWTYRVRRLLASLEVEDEPRLSSPSHEVEHEAYASLLAERSGVRTPPVLMTTELGHGPALLVREKVKGRRLPQLAPHELDDGLLDEIWQQVLLLGDARIAHHELTANNVLVDEKNDPWILDFTFSRTGASDTRLAQDVAEMLISLTSVVGVQRAVDSAFRTLTSDRVRPAVTYLQPLAVPARIRDQLGGQRWLLADLASEVAGRLGQQRPSFRPRIRATTILTLIVGGGAVYLLLPQLGTLPRLTAALRQANYWWLVAAFAASALTFPASAASYIGSVPRHLPWGRTTLVQVASAFTSRLTPGGVGGMGLNLIFLEGEGSSRAEAVGSIALNQAASVVVHAALFFIAVGVLGLSGVVGRHPLPTGWPVLVGVAGALVCAGALLGSPFGRRKVLAPTLRVGRELARALRSPRQALGLFGGAAGVTLGNAVALVTCLAAFDPHFPLLSAMAVYVGGSAIASPAPTPGKLGAVEAALVAGLTGIGVHSEPAVAAVLTFRLISFWIPIVPGLATFRYLQHRRVV
ncbi:MAG TPA: lysylphosphatidylglycerol synthase transmembrane domain-containing protein [Acidimicrobiales bacterium]|nr:lysylphosphatidylglycerol synthase transmembrane domain-containing protein [Acidimicrobiales bacterium]